MNCHKCRHHLQNEGTYHVRCGHPLLNGLTDLPMMGLCGGRTAFVGSLALELDDIAAVARAATALGIEVDKWALQKGWADWPFDFDPLHVLTCGGFNQNPEQAEGKGAT